MAHSGVSRRRDQQDQEQTRSPIAATCFHGPAALVLSALELWPGSKYVVWQWASIRRGHFNDTFASRRGVWIVPDERPLETQSCKRVQLRRATGGQAQKDYARYDYPC